MSATLTARSLIPATVPTPTPTPPPAVRLPLQGLQAGFRRFTVAEYHKLIEIGVLTENDNVELLNGYLVQKMGHNPPHDGAVYAAQYAISQLLPAGWICRVQSVFSLSTSEPEPDLAIVRGDPRTFFTRHPGPADAGLLVEVADSSLAGDRADKGPAYAEAGVPEYWIVNLVDRQVEVYTFPSGPGVTPGYASRQDHPPGTALPLTLDGVAVGTVAVDDLLP